jgi:hypothetical protein
VIQFADLGAGLPMPDRPGAALREIHQAARAVNPSARAAYVDNDPLAVLHSRVFPGAARTWPTWKTWKVSRLSRRRRQEAGPGARRHAAIDLTLNRGKPGS